MEDTARVSESTLALVQFTVHTDRDAVGFDDDIDVDEMQDELTEVVRTWDDRLLAQPDTDGLAAMLAGVSEAYKAAVDPRHAVEDLRRIAALDGPGDFDVRLYSATDAADERRLTLYLAGAPATLTAVLPVLQQLGVDVLDEHPAEFTRADGVRCWLYDFGLRLDEATTAALAGRRAGRARARRSARRSGPPGAATPRPTGSPRWCCAPACPGGRSRCCAPTPATPASSAARSA